MNRFFLFKPDFHDQEIRLPDDVSHQIRNVLRLKSGDRIAILDNQNHEWIIELIIDSNQILGKILTHSSMSLEPTTKLTLLFSLSQRTKIELILQKCTEIGVSNFLPFVSKRSLVRNLDEVEIKRNRWEKIIQEAAEQCNRGHLPELHSAVSFESAVKKVEHFEIPLLAWENENKNQINSILAEKRGTKIGLMIGPEGGFETNEIQSAMKLNWIPVSLCKRILRMETAAFVGSALVINLLGD